MSLEGEELGLLDGTGDGGDGGDGGSGGDEESFILEEGADGGEGGGEGGEETPPGEEGSRGEGGGSAIVKFTPDAVKKGLREIVAANPEFAKKFPQLEKTIARALYKDQQITQHGGLQKINEALEAIEVHGGVDGIQEMAEEVAASRELEHGFEIGDPKVIDGWAKDYPSGFKKLIVPALDKLEGMDGPYFDSVFSYLATNKFDKHGVFSTFAALGEAISAGKNEDAVKAFNQIAKFLGDMKAMSGKAKISRDDRDNELDEREKSIEEKNYKIFYSSVRQDVNTAIMSEMNRLIRLGLPAGKKVKVELANRLRKEINAELGRVLTAKAGFQEKYDSVLHGGNKERAVRFIVSNARQSLPNVVKQLLKEFNLVGTAAGRQASGERATHRGGNNGAARVVPGRPKTSEVDFTKTDKARFLATMNSHGEAWGLDGKLHKW